MSKLRYFRIYCMDGANHIRRAEGIRASGDEQAIKAAEKIRGHQQCEVWEGERLVERLGIERTAGTADQATDCSAPRSPRLAHFR
jgi:hypothetical protein